MTRPSRWPLLIGLGDVSSAPLQWVATHRGKHSKFAKAAMRSMCVHRTLMWSPRRQFKRRIWRNRASISPFLTAHRIMSPLKCQSRLPSVSKRGLQTHMRCYLSWSQQCVPEGSDRCVRCRSRGRASPIHAATSPQTTWLATWWVKSWSSHLTCKSFRWAAPKSNKTCSHSWSGTGAQRGRRNLSYAMISKR